MMALWGWFVGTKIGRWLVGVTLVIVGLFAALAVAFVKGKHAQADEDKAAQAEEQAAFDRLAHQTQTDAAQAAARVQQDAVKQPVPDTTNRTDFDGTF